MSGRASFLGGLVGGALGPSAGRVARKLGGWLGRLILAGLLGVFGWLYRLTGSVRLSLVLMVMGAALIVAVTCALRSGRRPSWPSRPSSWPGELTYLYRWYAPDGTLLYVGITNNMARRTGQHADDRPWMQPGVHGTVQSFPNRDLALAAEEHAIKTERPRWNVVHNGAGR